MSGLRTTLAPEARAAAAPARKPPGSAPPPGRRGPGAGRRRLSGLITLLVLGGVAAAALAVPRLAAAPTHSFQISFSTVDGLLPGSNVLEAGSTVGQVTSVTPTASGRALVTVAVSGDHWPLHRGLSAAIRPTSLLGEMYVDLRDGTSPQPWVPRGPLQTSVQAVPVELDQVINSLDPRTRSAARILLDSLGAGVAGQAVNLNTAIATARQDLGHLATFGTTLNNRDPQLDQIIVGLDGVLGAITSNRQLGQLSQLISNGQKTLDAIERQRTALSRSFTDADRNLGDLNTALAGAAPSLRQTVSVLPELAGNLGGETSMLANEASLIDNTPTLETLLAGIEHGPTATGGGLEQGPQGNLPIFRICFMDPGTAGGCDGTGFSAPQRNSVPAADFQAGGSSEMLLAMLGA